MKMLIKAAAVLLIFVLGECAAQGNPDKPADHHPQSAQSPHMAANDRDRHDDHDADRKKEFEARKKEADARKREAEDRKKAEDRKRAEERRKAEEDRREREKSSKRNRRVCKVTGYDRHGDPIKKCYNQRRRPQANRHIGD